MTGWTVIRRSLAFYWRTNLLVALGAAVATAAIVGALSVGDSVSYSLRHFALLRLGQTELAVTTGDRFFRAALADELQKKLSSPVAPAMSVSGIARAGGGTRQTSGVQVLGVDERFWALGLGGKPAVVSGEDSVVLNAHLARQLDCRVGETIVLRAAKPSLLPREAPLSVADDDSSAMRLTVAAIVDDEHMGRFGLAASQLLPCNAFLPLRAMQNRLGLPGKANLLLLGGTAGGGPSVAQADAVIRECWQLVDADLEVRELPAQQAVELRSGRVFLDPAVVQAAAAAGPDPRGVLTYFVNELRAGGRSTPYSMVSAVGLLGDVSKPPPAVAPLPPDLGDNEVVINDWLAADLHAGPGDELAMTYYVLGPMRALSEQTSRFRIRAVVPIRGAAEDPSLMPDFPGLADSENCRDWKGGVPIHLDRIRRVDEDYWHEHRGTPKVFVTLAAGRRMWASRFGDLTSVRYPLAPGAAAAVAGKIRNALDPAAVGLRALPVRVQALAASDQAQDFGQLFLGLSFFLIVAALVLTGLLFVFGVEQRVEQTGLLLAVGWRPRAVRLLLAEGALLAVAGAIVGVPAGLLYTRAIILGLATAWSGAVAGAAVQFHATAFSLAGGAGAGLVAAGAVMWLALRRQTARPPRELLAAKGAVDLRPASRKRRMLPAAVAIAAAGAAGAIVLLTGAGRDRSAAGAFFAAGVLLLIAGLAGLTWLLTAVVRPCRGTALTPCGLALRATARRRGRSLAVAMLVACGSFLIVAVAANRPGEADTGRSSGTGGFALYGQASVPVYQDLNTPAGRKAIGLDDVQLAGAEFLALRQHDGDDASCLNLNRAQSPRLLGVPAEALARRGCFTFVKTLAPPPDRRCLEAPCVSMGSDAADPWRLLTADFGPGVVPAVGDDATVTWALGKKLGDSIPYRDGRGREFQVRIVGVLANSILQGGLLISQENFVSRYPDDAGWRVLLADAPKARAPAVAAALTRALADRGLEVSPAADRLAAFDAVENTYLSIFQALGGIGMALGAAGLGVTVLRNVMERRSELALLRAVGFTRRALRRMVLAEHAALLLFGLLWGAASALLAVLPALRTPGASLPLASLSITLTAIAASGLLWIHLASTWSLRGPLLDALRNE